jgi:hypothetical protein
MIFSGNYRYFRLPWVIRLVNFKKENRKSRVKHDFKIRCTELCNFISHLPALLGACPKVHISRIKVKYKKMYTYLSSSWLQENDATHPIIFHGQWTQKTSRYSSPVDHRSLMICAQVHKQCQIVNVIR